jgi:thiamine-phosphate pyrophosphorylase
MGTPHLRGLYAITDANLIPSARLEAAVEAALDGGAALIQYRDKDAGQARRHRQADALAALCRRHGAVFIVNDDVELAAHSGAHGVHLGEDDAPLTVARQRLGRRAIIGLSCYADLARARHAQTQGADYVAFGRFFPSATKPGAARAKPALLEAARRELRLPVAAIGGINASNGAALIEAGADMLAVVRGIFGAADVQSAARGVASLFHNE